MRTGQLQEAKAKLSKVVDLAVSEEPQLITRHGKPVVYIISAEAYDAAERPSLKNLLLNRPHPEIDLDVERVDEPPRDLDL